MSVQPNEFPAISAAAIRYRGDNPALCDLASAMARQVQAIKQAIATLDHRFMLVSIGSYDVDGYRYGEARPNLDGSWTTLDGNRNSERIVRDDYQQVGGLVGLEGIRPETTDNGTLYLKVAASGGNWILSIYKDAARTSKVGETAAYGTTGIKTVTPSATPGIGGNINVMRLGPADSDIVIHCDRMRELLGGAESYPGSDATALLSSYLDAATGMRLARFQRPATLPAAPEPDPIGESGYYAGGWDVPISRVAVYSINSYANTYFNVDPGGSTSADPAWDGTFRWTGTVDNWSADASQSFGDNGAGQRVPLSAGTIALSGGTWTLEVWQGAVYGDPLLIWRGTKAGGNRPAGNYARTGGLDGTAIVTVDPAEVLSAFWDGTLARTGPGAYAMAGAASIGEAELSSATITLASAYPEIWECQLKVYNSIPAGAETVLWLGRRTGGGVQGEYVRLSGADTKTRRIFRG